MDHAVALVEAYLRINGYSAMSECSDVEARHYCWFRTATDLDTLAFRFPGAGRLVPLEHEDEHSYAPDPVFGFLVMLEKGHRR